MVLHITIISLLKSSLKSLKDNLNVWEKIQENILIFQYQLRKGVDHGKSIAHRIKFINSFRHMSSSLLNLVDNLSEWLYCDKCIDCKSCLDYMSVKDDLFIFRCFECKKNYKEDFNKELIKKFANICEF